MAKLSFHVPVSFRNSDYRCPLNVDDTECSSSSGTDTHVFGFETASGSCELSALSIPPSGAHADHSQSLRAWHVQLADSCLMKALMPLPCLTSGYSRKLVSLEGSLVFLFFQRKCYLWFGPYNPSRHSGRTLVSPPYLPEAMYVAPPPLFWQTSCGDIGQPPWEPCLKPVVLGEVRSPGVLC